MSEPARNRFALDLDDLERQLRGAAQPGKPAAAPDPLAELTRIVHQDDPFKDILGQRAAAPEGRVVQPAWPARREPVLDAPAQGTPPAEVRGALDEFEALLRRSPADAAYEPVSASPTRPPLAAQPVVAPPVVERRAVSPATEPDYYPDDAYEQAMAGPSEEQEQEPLPELEPRRSRRGLWMAAAMVGVAAIGAGTALALRQPSAGVDGQPPVIAADSSPVKIAPVNPGGAEIPNQNKQIYERSADAPPAQTKVVSREEQPVDVRQVARSQPARVVMPGPGAIPQITDNPLAQAPAAEAAPALAPTTPGFSPVPPVPGLGEPRRVRTVAIRPDGTPAPTVTANAEAAPIATGSARPAASTQGVAATQAPAAAPQPPARSTTTTTPPKTQERAATPTPPAAPPTRVAVAAPSATAPALRTGSGDFAVQLAAPGSEVEARATFAALQKKYPGQLAGQNPIVRKTDLAGGKTVYRLRVGPFSREDAASMCTALQGAGGQCFIARN